MEPMNEKRAREVVDKYKADPAYIGWQTNELSYSQGYLSGLEQGRREMVESLAVPCKFYPDSCGECVDCEITKRVLRFKESQ